MTERVQRVIKKVQAFIADKDDAWSLPAPAARFVHGLVLARKPRRCLEIGTSYGHSGLWIGSAAAADGGTLLTIAREQRKSDIAAGFFREAGLEKVITCRVGIAAEIIATLEGPIDLVLNDADKENCRRYVEMLSCRYFRCPAPQSRRSIWLPCFPWQTGGSCEHRIELPRRYSFWHA